MMPLPWVIALLYLFSSIEIHVHRNGGETIIEEPNEEVYQEQNPTYYVRASRDDLRQRSGSYPRIPKGVPEPKVPRPGVGLGGPCE